MMPASGRLRRRPAEASDVSWLLALRLATMSGYLQASGQALSQDDQKQRVLWRFDCIEILMLDHVPVGMCKIVRDSTPWKLVQIQCLPSRQRRGIGSRVIGALLADAAAAGCAVELSVLKVNPARSLYERLGFRVVATKADSYTMRAEPVVLPS